MGLYNALRWDLVLTPLLLLGWVGLRIKLRYLLSRSGENPVMVQQMFGYRVGSYVVLLLVMVSLLPWAGMILTLRFDWSRNDVSEIEIRQFALPYPQDHAVGTYCVKNAETLSRLFDGLESRKQYVRNHEHAVGKSYVLRLRRKSDGQWSKYEVAVYPDMETVNQALRLADAHVVAINYATPRWENIGGDYQSADLGRLVEQLSNEGTLVGGGG